MANKKRRSTASGTVKYNGDSHISVLCQVYGSVWCKVLPYCLLNVLICGVLLYLKRMQDIDLGVSGKGHTMMSMVVSFLIVTRTTLTMGRWNEARDHLAGLFKTCRDLVQTSVALTQYDEEDGAREWRNELAYRTMLLLRVSVAMLDHASSKIPSWSVPEVCETEREYLKNHLVLDESDMRDNFHSNSNGNVASGQRWAHRRRTIQEENLRVPIRMAFRLRLSITSQKEFLTEKLAPPEQGKLLSFVDEFTKGYHGLRKLITTPFPFPLVQMTRTFLFFYVYTLPFALLGDEVARAQIVIVFIITYGFVGLEYVNMELDDPFGDDPNDLDDLNMAYTVFEDIYLTIFDIDGTHYTDKLRGKMHSGELESGGNNGLTEKSWLLTQ